MAMVLALVSGIKFWPFEWLSWIIWTFTLEGRFWVITSSGLELHPSWDTSLVCTTAVRLSPSASWIALADPSPWIACRHTFGVLSEWLQGIHVEFFGMQLSSLSLASGHAAAYYSCCNAQVPWLKHNLGFMSVVAAYTPTETCETEEIFYTKLDSVLDQCPRRDALVVLGNFNAVTDTKRVATSCLGPHVSGTKNDNSSLLLNLARS